MATTKQDYGDRSVYDRRNPYRRPSALGVASKHKWKDSETRDLYSAKSVSARGQQSRPNDHIQYDGLDFEDGTETERYKGHDGSTGRADLARVPDSIQAEKGGANGISENHDRYSPKEGGRREATKMARESHLQYDGLDFNEGSSNSQYMKDMDVETPVRYRGATNLRPLDGSMKGETEQHDKFSAKYGRRAGMMKREDYIKPNGLEFEGGTENGEYLNNMSIEKPTKYTSKTHLQTLDGSVDGTSESSDKFIAKYGRRSEKLRSKSAIQSTGLDFEQETETISKFDLKKIGNRERINKEARESHIKSEGLDFREDTENHQYLRNMRISTPTRFRSLDSLSLLKGDMLKKTEYNGKYTNSARRGSSRVRPMIEQDLITPYGDLASSAVRLGDRRRYQVATA